MIKQLAKWLLKRVKREQFGTDGEYYYVLSVKHKLTNSKIAKREKVAIGSVQGKIHRHRLKHNIPPRPSPLGQNWKTYNG